MTDRASIEAMHRRIAAGCNDIAWKLIETPDLDMAALSRLVTVASAARYHWHSAGSPSDFAHADLVFAWAQARAGAAKVASYAARQALTHFEGVTSEPWERALANAALALSLHSAGDETGYRRHYAKARELGEQLGADQAKCFGAAFRTLPVPPKEELKPENMGATAARR